MAYSSHNLDFLQKAILTSVIYSDIFDFPLTEDELFEYLISGKKIKRDDFNFGLQNLQKSYLSQKDGYIFLKTRGIIVKDRKHNIYEVERKWKIAQRASFYLSHIPSILFIGISGGLAMRDVARTDDIDFFVITKSNTVFKSRLFILFILQILNLRRKRQDVNPTDKICVNFLIDEESLAFAKDRQDLYTAHEILQLKPLYDKGGTFDKFLNCNKWINNFFKNASRSSRSSSSPANRRNLIVTFLTFVLNAVFSEKLCKSLQMIFIQRHRRHEIVTNHVLAFNPNDYRVLTLEKLRLKLQELGLLTKF